MESIYAALLLHKAGKTIEEKAISKILEAAGVEVDKNQVKALVAGLSGKNIDELIASAAAVPVAAAPAAASAGEEKKGGKESKKEEKEEKKKEEEVAGLGSLFD
jgi:large subunit ribosomal protein L12